MNEQTEMGEAPNVETEAIYAWALDDGDDLPTQRLTSRRITSLSLAVSLVLIAVAGVVALTVVHNTNQPVAQAPSPHVVETVARPAPPSPTPPPPVPTPSVRGNNAANEDTFVSGVFANIPTADIPGGRPNNEELVAYGYQACTVMDRYPGDRRGATNDFYEGLWPKDAAPRPTITQVDERNFFQFMDYAATYLCPRNAATSPVVQVAPPPVKAVEPPPAPTPGCTEGATRVSQGEGDISTCENGQWHEGPYGYLQKPAAQPHGGWCDGNGSVEAIAPNGRSMFCVTGPDGAGSWEYGP